MTERRKFTTRERIGVITESGFSAEGLALSGSPRAMRALEGLISVLCDMVLSQREQVQRVREVHQWVVDDEDDPWQVSFATGWDAALAEVRRALDDAEQSEYWDGTTPLGDDDMDGQ